MIDRNDILDKAINIESLLSALITIKFFPGEVLNLHFTELVLNDESATANFKRSVFVKCYPEAKKLDEDIRKIFSIRNTFAHIGAMHIHLMDGSNSGHLDPKKPGQHIDLEEKQEQFKKSYDVVCSSLFDMLKNSELNIVQGE